MVGISLFTVAICYFGSFAIANEDSSAKTSLKDDLVLFEKLIYGPSAEKLKTDIEKALNGKDKEKVYKYVKDFYDGIKKNCNIFATEIRNEESSSDIASDNLFTQLKDLLKSLEDKCKNMRAFALLKSTDHCVLTKLVESGIIKNGDNIKYDLNKRNLKKCYRSFYHYIDGLEKVLGIEDRATSRSADIQDTDYDDVYDEVDLEDCNDPTHHGHFVPTSTGLPNIIKVRLPGVDENVVQTPTSGPGSASTSHPTTGQTETSQTSNPSGDHSSSGTTVPGKGAQSPDQLPSGELPVTTERHPENPVQPSPTAAPSESGPKGPAQNQNNNIRGEEPVAGQKSNAYIPLFTTAVATVLVSVF